MLKAQDVVLLVKLLASQQQPQFAWTQAKLALHLCLSSSEVNSGLKRLRAAHLLTRAPESFNNGKTVLQHLIVVKSCEELLSSGVKYFFPAQLGEHTRGIATSYAAPIFKDKITLGHDPIPVWPFAEGEQCGSELLPLYPSIPQALTEYPDQCFYDMLALLDALRQGRARERDIATKLLREKLKNV